jgi:cell division initiation protein
MKITPIEIRQHTFQRGLRGYDVEEVAAFLTSLSNEWERVLNENKMLKMQLEIAEKELSKLREVELTMFRMLKTAEDTSAQMTEQAKTAAEVHIEDARQKGRGID